MAPNAAKWLATWRAKLPAKYRSTREKPAETRFGSLSYYRNVIAHAIIDDAGYQLSQDEALELMGFDAMITWLPPDKKSGEYTSLLIAVNAGRATGMLPRKGEKCKIVMTVDRTKNEAYELDLRGQLRSLLLEQIPLLSNEYQISALDLDLKETDALATLGIASFDLADTSRQTPATVIRDSLHDLIRNCATTARIEDNVHQFVETHLAHLRLPQVTAADERELRTLYAQRLELPFPEVENTYCFFTGKVNFEPISESVGGTRRRCNFKIPKPSTEGIDYLGWLQKAFAGKKTPIKFKILSSVQTARTEITAWLELMELTRAKPSLRTKQIRDYVVNFRDDDPTETRKQVQTDTQIKTEDQTQTDVQAQTSPEAKTALETEDDSADNVAQSPSADTAGIFAKFPAFKSVANGTAESYLMAAYNSLDPAQTATFDSIPTGAKHGLVPIEGAFGCGKTYMLCVTLLIAMSSGKQKGMVVLPTNAEVDDMADKFPALCQKFGVPTPPHVLRVYSRDSEVSAATAKTMPTENDDNDDVAQFSPQGDDDDDFTALTKLSAQLVLQGLLDANKTRPSARQNFNNRSLHVEALARYRTDPKAYPGLTRALRDYNLDPEPELRTRAEHEIQGIFGSILSEADVVMTTPYVSRGSQLRDKFHPTIVIQDENGRSHESETMMVVSSYPTAVLHLICGDSLQFRPFTAGQRYRAQAKREKPKSRIDLLFPKPTPVPYSLQYEMSFIERAGLAGATIGPGLFTNHRQRAGLGDLPNELFYEGAVIMSQKQWTEKEVRLHAAMRKCLGPRLDLYPEKNRVMVSLKNHWERKVGTSYTNPAQLRYAMDFADKLLDDPGFTGTIGIISPYDAMIADVHDAIRTYQLDTERITARTIDSAQGFEFDFVISLFPRTTDPGFMGDAHRLNVALTRSIQGELIMFEPHILVKLYKHGRRPPELVPGSWHLAKMVEVMSREHGSILSMIFCSKCGGGHYDGHCDLCGRCEKPGHETKDCPTVTCLWCGKNGHINIHCQENPERRCECCQKQGHLRDSCPARQTCWMCGEEGHKEAHCSREDYPEIEFWNLSGLMKRVLYPKEYEEKKRAAYLEAQEQREKTALERKEREEKDRQLARRRWAETTGAVCYLCEQKGHIRDDCPQKPAITCWDCGEKGHNRDKCPRKPAITCLACGEEGHILDDCTCWDCGEKGHNRDDCPQKPVSTCWDCGEEGHIRVDCPQKPVSTCFDCGEEGHIRDDCPQKPVSTCFNCGEEGHIQAHLPEEQARILIEAPDA